MAPTSSSYSAGNWTSPPFPTCVQPCSEVRRTAPVGWSSDFSGVTFCDSQGLSALIGLNKELKGTGCQLVLTNLGDFMVRLLDITGLHAAFTID